VSRRDGPSGPHDPAAWYARFGVSLHRYALMILANRQDAEDAVHQVFARLVHARSGVRVDAIEPYLRSAVRNECFSVLRQRQRAPNANADALLEGVVADHDPAERLSLDAALRQLPAEQREVVHLKVFEGRTFQEIADLTSESINTVASRWRYALEKLRAALETRQS
jgi:RNA polymerase sigma-70 factor, ECF subfamily